MVASSSLWIGLRLQGSWVGSNAYIQTCVCAHTQTCAFTCSGTNNTNSR